MKKLILAMWALILVGLGSFLLFRQGWRWVDTNHAIFFPNSLRADIQAPQQFPAFWWSFVVVEGDVNESELLARGRDWCRELKTFIPVQLSSVECQHDLQQLGPQLTEWTQILPYRMPYPGLAATQNKLQSGLARASLLALDPQLLQMLRLDPLEQWKDLEQKSRASLPLNSRYDQGFLRVDRGIVIPFQFRSSPTDGAATRRVAEKIATLQAALPPGSRVHWIGPHASTFQNQKQIMSDLERVSWFGTPVFLLLGILLWVLRRRAYFALLALVAVATLSAVLLTVLIYGSIHGLTLSFGVGIIGLAIDYGLHASFAPPGKSVWKANFFGLMSTLLGIGVLIFSQVPLMQQIMVFSLIGLSLGYAIYYLVLTQWPTSFHMRAFKNPAPSPKIFRYLTWAVAAIGVGSVFLLKPALDLAHFDYTGVGEQEFRTQFFKSNDMKSPLYIIHDSLTQLREREWQYAREIENSSFRLNGLSTFLPSLEVQSENRRSWIENCPTLLKSSTEVQRKFFAPFFEKVCAPQMPVTLDASQLPSKLGAFRNGEQYLTLITDKGASPQQSAALRERFPEIRSPQDLVVGFPRLLLKDLMWMLPAILILTFSLLFFYYRHWQGAVVALLPFAAGLGAFYIALKTLGQDFTFIGLMGGIMLFGFSLDYGIFASDFVFSQRPRSAEDEEGLWSSLFFNALTNFMGFFPFLLCEHPVLKHLGTVLFFGSVGAYFGAYWGLRGLRWTVRSRFGTA